MKITVLNGSPRGRYSTTLHSVLYLQKRFRDDTFEIVEVGTAIRSLEKNPAPMLESLRRADMVLFSYPVYTFVVPAQLHRAIEIIKASGVDLKGKFAAQVTTSKHFYDVTAHGFIRENAEDMGMEYVRGFSADMEDLLTEKGRMELVSFWEFVRFRCSSGGSSVPYEGPSRQYDIAVVAESPDDTGVSAMITELTSCCKSPVRVVYLSDLKLKGGCTGCFSCASDGTCIYTDGFSDFLRKEILSADALVYAFRVRDHSMGSVFKLYDDRQFCNGHRMMTIGMPLGYLVCGSLEKEPNLRMIMEARAQVGRNVLCRIVSDDSAEGEIGKLADEIVFALDRRMTEPQNFYGVGGTRIFRDLIWQMRGLMRADHRFYRKHGIYDDFPQRHIGKMLQMKLIGFLFNNRKIRKKMGNRLNEGMVMPYRKIIDSI